MSGLLAGRVAIVSGIGPGAGRSIALACAREGADVVLAARTVGALEQVADPQLQVIPRSSRRS